MRTAGPARRRLSRAVVRAPILVYRHGLGGLLGQRFVLLTHTGRTTGFARQVVLEVVGSGVVTGSYVVASGYGARAQWYRNVLADPDVTYQVGRKRWRGSAHPLPPEESGRRLAGYAIRHPRAAAALMRMLAHDVDGSSAGYERIGADTDHGVPLVMLLPAPAPSGEPG